MLVQPDEPGKLVVLTGRRGTGKTAMGIEVMRMLMKCRVSTRFSVLEEYLRLVRFKPDWESVQMWFEDPKLVVIDEVAKISDQPFDQRQFFHIVNTRYSDNKHTLLICSVELPELADFLGASLADRVQDGGEVLHCNWQSLRK